MASPLASHVFGLPPKTPEVRDVYGRAHQERAVVEDATPTEALERAIRAHDCASVRRLLSGWGAKADAVTKLGFPLLHLANTTIARILLNHGAPVDATNPEGRTALHGATEWSRTDRIALLIKRGANVNAQERGKSMTPLMLFISRAALPPAQSRSRSEPADWGVVDLLLSHGADPNVRNSSGDAAIHILMNTMTMTSPLQEQLEAFNAILDAGADINLVDGFGWTPLHVAISLQLVLIATWLLERGADVTVTTTRARTIPKTPAHLLPPHMQGVSDRHPTIDIPEGSTPVDVATALGNEFIRDLIEEEVLCAKARALQESAAGGTSDDASRAESKS